MRRNRGVIFNERLKGMETMSDDFDKMYHSLHDRGGRRLHVGRVLISLALLLLVLGGGYLLFDRLADRPPRPGSAEVPLARSLHKVEMEARDALARGDYDQAHASIERHRLADLGDSLQDTLLVTFLFNYDLPQAAPERDGWLQLPPGTPFFISIQPEERCYLYLLRRDTAGQWQQLLPDDSQANSVNPLAPISKNIPASGRLFNTAGPGTEKIFLSASRWRQQGLEELIRRVVTSAGGEQPLLDYLDRQHQAMQKYPGIVCKQYSFDHNL